MQPTARCHRDPLKRMQPTARIHRDQQCSPAVPCHRDPRFLQDPKSAVTLAKQFAFLHHCLCCNVLYKNCVKGTHKSSVCWLTPHLPYSTTCLATSLFAHFILCAMRSAGWILRRQVARALTISLKQRTPECSRRCEGREAHLRLLPIVLVHCVACSIPYAGQGPRSKDTRTLHAYW